MRTCGIIIALLFLNAIRLPAQSGQQVFGQYGQVYRLTDAEAKAIYNAAKQPVFRDDWLHSPVDTFQGVVPVRPLVPGHYLLVRAVGENIWVETYSTHTIQPWLLPHRCDFLLQLVDSTGQPIRLARVVVDGSTAPFDTVSQCYRLNRRIKNGFVEIFASGESWFGQVNDILEKPLWSRWLQYHMSYGVGRALTAPVRLGRRTWWRAKGLFSPGYMRYRRRRVQSAHFSGYMAFNKPKYQPGDTLHLKAYLADGKGRPWKRAVRLEIQESKGKGRQVLAMDIAPLSPGAFVFEMPLSDSLRLDMAYWVTFKEKSGQRKKRQRSLHQSFYFEDYQLDEIRYTVTPEKPEFSREEPVVLQLDAKDMNGHGAPDASFRLVLKSKATLNFLASEVWVPDTLWQTEQVFSSSGKSVVVVPDSIWPEVDLRVAVQTDCINSAGEMQQKSAEFTVHRRHSPLNIRVDKGILIAERYRPTGRPDSVWLQEIHADGRITERRISLPLQAPVSPDIQRYAFRYAGQTVAAPMPAAVEVVRHLAIRRQDTVALGLTNPHRLNVRYQVFEGKRLLVEGVVQDTFWTWVAPAAPGRSYRLDYQFVWLGEAWSFSANAVYYERLLNILLEQPEQVAPGETVQVKVRVEDSRRRPVQGVNLTAGAYNQQFDSEVPYRAPDIRYRLPHWGVARQDLALSRAPARKFSIPLTRNWYDRLQLDSLLYYRLRYRGNGYYAEATSIDAVSGIPTTDNRTGPGWGLPPESDTVYLRRPQFAPYLIRGNQSQPIYLIYCNSRLVYYYGNTGVQRYSFYGREGYNQIRIRTRDGEYTLDSIYLESGKKLEIALDGDRYRHARLPVKVQFAPRPDSLTSFEKALLRKTMFLWRSESPSDLQYFWSGPYDIQALPFGSSKRVHVLGPFDPGTTLHFLRSGQFHTAFRFEPGFEYQVAPGRERLYDSAWPNKQGALPKLLEEKRPGEVSWTPGNIVMNFSWHTRINYIWPGRHQPGRGKLQLRFLNTDTLRAVVLLGDTLLGPFRPGGQEIGNILPGRYRLLVYTTGGYRYRREIRIRRDTLLFLDLDKAVYTMPVPEERLDQLFPSGEGPGSTSSLSTPTSRFYQLPGIATGQCVIRGKLNDDAGEELIGATVKAFQGGVLIGGTISDYNGDYRLVLPPGVYDLEFSYTGFESSRVPGVVAVAPGGVNDVNQALHTGSLLDEVVVVAYSVPLIEQDRTSAGMTLSSSQISNLPTRSVSAILAGTAAGVIDIKGSRNNALNYYVDGIPVDGNSQGLGWYDRAGDPLLGIRSHFSDYAYWQPNLLTDQNGEASFRVTFPENITSWNSFVLGMDRRKRAGMTTQNTRSFRPLLARLTLPRFAVAGDRFDAAGLTQNLNGDSIRIHTVFRVNNQIVQENHNQIGEGLAEFAAVLAPVSGADSLFVSYETYSGTMADGEKRGIGVKHVGTIETTGFFAVLERDTTLALAFDPALGPVTVQVQDNALYLLIDDIRYLREYPYWCNEQTSGRLIALLLEKEVEDVIGKTAGSIAVNKNAALREREINACLQRLRQGQLADGSWGWWSGGTPNVWMTVYVLRALKLARVAGYSSDTWDKGLIWLRHEAPAMAPETQRETLLFLREADVNFDCAPYLARLDTLPFPTLHARLSHWRLQQLCGRPLSRDSLSNYLEPTTLGGRYAGDDNTRWYDRRAVNTVLAFDLAKQAGWADITSGIRQYWLESRPASRRRNTIETAEILRRLLPDLLEKHDSLRTNRVVINGIATDKFPVKLAFDPNTADIFVSKTGNTPVYMSAYQKWHNPAPVPRDDLFAVESWLEQEGRRVDSLHYGVPAKMVVQVQVRQSAEYVMVQVPVPAGCSYGEKRQYFQPEVHREYFRDRVAIFCETLPVGRYDFRVELEPRFSGQFTLNPVQVEQMYFPVFYGRNGVREVRISK